MQHIHIYIHTYIIYMQYIASLQKDFNIIFADFMTYNDLYQKPVFGDCMWSNWSMGGNMSSLECAWIPPQERVSYGEKVCYILQFMSV